MAITRSRRAVVAFAAMIFVLLGALAAYRVTDVAFYFNLALIGFLMILGLSGPFTVMPKWRSRAGIVIAIGGLIFLAIVLQKISAIGLSMTQG